MRSISFLMCALSTTQTADPADFFEPGDIDNDVLKQMQQAYEEAQQKVKAENMAQLGQSLVEAIKLGENHRSSRISQIRQYKRMIERLKSELEGERLARVYGGQTGNYLPWLKLVGQTDFMYSDQWRALTSDEQQKLTTIPDTWKPKTSTKD